MPLDVLLVISDMDCGWIVSAEIGYFTVTIAGDIGFFAGAYVSSVSYLEICGDEAVFGSSPS